MPTPLDELRQLVDGTRPPPPIATLIGFTLTAVSPGEAVIALAASRQHANPMGALHGGVLGGGRRARPSRRPESAEAISPKPRTAP